MSELYSLSPWQRVQLGHAALQLIADRHGIDLLHLKGPALDAELAPSVRNSSDADVWVRPSQVNTFIALLKQHGWDLRADFDEGSPFEHAATLWHDDWCYVDVHRYFPGLPATETCFNRFWSDHKTLPIGGRDCFVPSTLGQRLVLILHAARKDSSKAHTDLAVAWHDADEATRQALTQLVDEVGAQVGFAAALGHLDDYRGTRQWRMWVARAHPGDRLGEWWARFQLAQGVREKAHVLTRFVRVNRAHLAMQLGREPSAGEIARAYVDRAVQGVSAVAEALASKIRGGR